MSKKADFTSIKKQYPVPDYKIMQFVGVERSNIPPPNSDVVVIMDDVYNNSLLYILKGNADMTKFPIGKPNIFNFTYVYLFLFIILLAFGIKFAYAHYNNTIDLNKIS